MTLPFQDGSFAEIRAEHVLEHIEKRDHVRLLNECWRVMEDGGVLAVEVPVFPYEVAIADPTHVSFFVSRSFDYFCQGQGHDEHMALYGIKPWKLILRQRIGEGQLLQVEMEKEMP